MIVLKYKKIPDNLFKNYVRKKNKHFRKKYAIKMSIPLCIDISTLVYAIMIFENYNRPWYLRFLEYLIFALKKVSNKNPIMSLGIMQVQVSRVIFNKKSIELAISKIKQDIACLPCETLSAREIITNVAKKYNNNNMYVEQIYKIYSYICVYESYYQKKFLLST